jgi:hypothetical protein
MTQQNEWDIGKLQHFPACYATSNMQDRTPLMVKMKNENENEHVNIATPRSTDRMRKAHWPHDALQHQLPAPTATTRVGSNDVSFNTTATRWLGVWLDSQLTLKEHHAISLKEGKKALGHLRRLTG